MLYGGFDSRALPLLPDDPVDRDPLLELTAFYLWQRELNVGTPEIDHVFGLELSYEIDSR